MTTVVKAGAVAFVLGVAGLVAVYFLFIKSDSPPPVSIDEAVRAVTTPTATSGAGANPASGSGGRPGSLEGTWAVTSPSFVGYRVEEQLVNIGAQTAVGRTSAVTGSLTFDGSAITALEVTADLRQLRSDNGLRDGQLRNQAIQTNTYPTAKFVLTAPIEIGTPPAEGQTITRTVQGDLTLHGVTRQISMEVQGQLTNGQVVVVGSTTILFADYQIGQPRGASVVSIDDKGVMELQLVFAKAAG